MQFASCSKKKKHGWLHRDKTVNKCFGGRRVEQETHLHAKVNSISVNFKEFCKFANVNVFY